MPRALWSRLVPACASLCCASHAAAAGAAGGFNGAQLTLVWALPFAGLLLSIALIPLVAQRFWHHHYGKFAAAWAVALLVPMAWTFGIGEAWHQAVHAILLEYIPFVAILFALYTIAGGICVHGPVAGTPLRNTLLLALGAVLASLMGTTGASMLLIRPLLAGNETRRHRVHAVVFFILLVGNVGGALSPLGDPPLFIGYLKGVDFFWTTTELAKPTFIICGALLVAFFVLDRWFQRHDPPAVATEIARGPIWIEGKRNFLLLAGVVGAVLMSGMWKPGIEFTIFGTPVALQALLRDALLVGLALVSLAVTPRAVREHNVFHWEPIVEVAKIFAGIFITIIPALAMLGAGRDGAFAAVLDFIARPDGTLSNPMVFWTTGVLSAFLDNAPTYLVFFNLAGGDAQQLMGARAASLAALSMGAVYFGALTYVGNAPNFMIKAIAEDRDVPMPSFFGYLAYAALAMLPLLALVSWLVL